MAESDAAKDSKPPLTAYAQKIREITGHIEKDTATVLNHSKSKEYRTMRCLSQEIKGLKEESEKQKLINSESERKFSELKAEISTLKGSSAALIYDVRGMSGMRADIANMKQVQEYISRSNQCMRVDMANMTQAQEDISRSNQCMRDDMANMTQAQEDISRSNQCMRVDIANMKQAQEGIYQSNQCMRDDMANMKQVQGEISRSNQGIGTDMANMKQAQEGIYQSNQCMRSDIANMKQVQGEISRSNQGIGTDMANMNQKLDTIVNLQLQQKPLQTQRYASTSTLDTVDTGFDEMPAMEEAEEVAQCQPEDKEAKAKKRIMDLAPKLVPHVHFRVKILARYLGLDGQCIEDIRKRQSHDKDYGNQLFDVIEEWFELCRKQRKSITMKNFLDGLREAGVLLKVKRMSNTDQYIIERNVPYMTKNMLVKPALTELRQCGLLTPDYVNYILEMNSETERVVRLVEILQILGDRALPALIEALEKSGQPHVAQFIDNDRKKNYQLPSPESATRPVAEVGSSLKQDETNVKQRGKRPIKETRI